jgi:ADP-dependent phosphofructokinase/glucokinase
MEKNVSIINLEELWNLKTEAHNNMLNYLESIGLDEDELLKFVGLLNNYSNSNIKFNNYI